MAEKVIFGRVQQKYDTYENWTTKNPILAAGELAICTVQTNTGGVHNAPSLLIKVGDGTNNYNDLKFVSGLAADVYDWAKAATKPSYRADEISGLSDYISGAVEDTDTNYQIVKVDSTTYKLQSKSKGGSWVDVAGSTIAIPSYDDTAVKKDISNVSAKVTTLIGSDASKSVRTIANEELVKQLIPSNASESLDTLQEIAAWIQAHPDDASAMSASIAKIQSQLSGIAQTNGAVASLITTKITESLNGLSAIAKSGNVKDLVQTAGDVLILDCGNATV